MIFPSTYQVFNISSIKEGEYELLPVRYNDRNRIREWRNAQIELLRQKEFLSEEEQKIYFLNVVLPTFKDTSPRQLLFSYFRNDKLIGYGGLVHIDWYSRNAEISFLLDPERNNKEEYHESFTCFLSLILKVAAMIGLHRIYTVGYDVEEYRFQPLIDSNFLEEGVLKNHVSLNGNFYNIRLYAKLLS